MACTPPAELELAGLLLAAACTVGRLVPGRGRLASAYRMGLLVLRGLQALAQHAAAEAEEHVGVLQVIHYKDISGLNILLWYTE